MKVIKNFLSKKTINYLINYHNDNFSIGNNVSKKHRNTEVIMCYNDLESFKEIQIILNNFIKGINKNYIINYFEIVKWPCGEFQSEHLDFDFHPYTTILYLNDDYEGGETVVGDRSIKPKKNKLIGFEGNKIIHQVKKITKGTRYTLPCWYRSC